MNGAIAILAIGFLLGMRHATDPDHVIAVSTIVSRERSIGKAGAIGILWGIGHTLTILVVGAGIILFGMAIPTRVGLTMELSVGLMLVLLGILNLTGAMKWMSEKLLPTPLAEPVEHTHFHSNGAHLHSHSHSHDSGNEPRRETRAPQAWLGSLFARLGLYHALRPVLIGIVHGLAGSAAVALLVLSTIRDAEWGVVYLLIFGVGTIVGMMIITAALALPFSFAGYRFSWLNKSLITASGLISLGFGLFISYQVGFVNGLFLSHANWTPH
jgi:hypothetical protein